MASFDVNVRSSEATDFTGVEDVRFICSRCKQILHLDPSFANIDQQTFLELVTTARRSNSTASESNLSPRTPESNESPLENSSSSEDAPPQEQDVYSSGSDKLKPHTTGAEPTSSLESSSIGNNKVHGSVTSFTMIGDVRGTSMETFSHKLNTIVKLFDILSANTDLDHPLCEECNDQVLDQFDKELKETQSNCEIYHSFLKKLEKDPVTQDEIALLTSELESLKEEEKSLLSELEETERERESTRENIEKIKMEKQKLESEEKRFLQDYAEFRARQLELDEEQKSVENQLRHAENQLKRLQKTNVFNATFHIWHQGPFGTINGFRLGRVPGTPVEWSEINAAWGQTTLLLASLIKKMGLKLKRFRLVPFGNHSYIETLENKPKELPLYGSGGFRLLWDTKFDQGMVAFLDCLQQFKEEVEQSKKGFKLPYKMEKGKIEDTGGTGTSYWIKLQFNSEEQWTKALKFMLTNLKWGLAWVSSEFSSNTSS
ncbi:beclin-1-like [Styela clava]